MCRNFWSMCCIITSKRFDATMTSLVCQVCVVKRCSTGWRSLLRLLSRQEILHGLIDLFILLHEWPVTSSGDVGHTQARYVLLGQLRHGLLKGKVLLAPNEMGRYLGGNETAYDFYEFFVEYGPTDIRLLWYISMIFMIILYILRDNIPPLVC